MDPLSQGVVGITLAQTFSKKAELRLATLAGAVGGMLADVDIFIRSDSDPLLNLQYHRHFTHSLTFIPVGALIAALLLWPLLRKRCSFGQLYVFTLLGYGTAGLLDACTTYGTQLLWPFSNARIAWNSISIIDPIFTFTLVGLAIFTAVKRSALTAKLGLAFMLSYLSLGFYQQSRAERAIEELAESRGHSEAARFLVHPSIGNLLLWRGVYEYQGDYYFDAVNIGVPGFGPFLYEGSSLPKYSIETSEFPVLSDSVLAYDIERFSHFSSDWVSQMNEASPYILGDVRYALLPNGKEPLWGLVIDPDDQDKHPDFDQFRRVTSEDWATLWKMLRREPLGVED